MKKLIDQFNTLPLPDTNKAQFSALPIKTSSGHRIGKTKDGEPCILLKVRDKKSDEYYANTKLKNIKVWFDIECTISIGKKHENKTFTVINFSGEDESLYHSFLRVAEILLEELGDNPSKKEVSKVVNTFIRLFKNISDFPQKTIQGLWAELFLISQSKKVEELIKSWHVKIEDKHDFNLGKVRIEAKSSSKRKREHYFSLEQLDTILNSEIYVASLFVERSDYGKSMEELVEEIKQKIKGKYELLEKIYLICYKTLGNSLDMSFRMKFDHRLAKDSLKFYDIKEIPKLVRKNLPSAIVDIKLLVNLDKVKAYKKSDITSIFRI